MGNPWSFYKNHIAYWHIVFPKESVKNKPDLLIRFAEQFCLMCAVYRIAQVESISNPIASWNSSLKQSYPEHIKEIYEKTGKIPFFYHEPTAKIAINAEQSIIPTKICFSTENSLREESIDDLHELLKELRPKLNKHKDVNKPVNLQGDLIIPSELDLGDMDPWMSISLHSDIWLPFVVGYGDIYASELVSNEAIASCHTPRFNNWLKAVRQISEDLGANWEFDGGGHFPKYVPMLSEDGIILNYQPG